MCWTPPFSSLLLLHSLSLMLWMQQFSDYLYSIIVLKFFSLMRLWLCSICSIPCYCNRIPDCDIIYWVRAICKCQIITFCRHLPFMCLQCTSVFIYWRCQELAILLGSVIINVLTNGLISISSNDVVWCSWLGAQRRCTHCHWSSMETCTNVLWQSPRHPDRHYQVRWNHVSLDGQTRTVPLI